MVLSILLITCLPLQMVDLYKDPKGENIFKKISAVSGISVKESDSKNSEREMQGLQKRIQQLEKEVRERDVCSLATHDLLLGHLANTQCYVQ